MFQVFSNFSRLKIEYRELLAILLCFLWKLKHRETEKCEKVRVAFSCFKEFIEWFCRFLKFHKKSWVSFLIFEWVTTCQLIAQHFSSVEAQNNAIFFVLCTLISLENFPRLTKGFRAIFTTTLNVLAIYLLFHDRLFINSIFTNRLNKLMRKRRKNSRENEDDTGQSSDKPEKCFFFKTQSKIIEHKRKENTDKAIF